MADRADSRGRRLTAASGTEVLIHRLLEMFSQVFALSVLRRKRADFNEQGAGCGEPK